APPAIGKEAAMHERQVDRMARRRGRDIMHPTSFGTLSAATMPDLARRGLRAVAIIEPKGAAP
ncbi:MAG: hypothetical protein L0H19_08110, partial [Salinisphaera sp.]|nr:hypothetical protein [Salinisphaera sp.]